MKSTIIIASFALALLSLFARNIAAVPRYDIIYLLDESGSMSGANFTAEKNFASNSANGLLFGPNDTAASLIEYAASPQFTLNFTTTKSVFLNTINTSVVQSGGSTDLTAALS